MPAPALATALIPYAGLSGFVGLSLLTTGQLAADGLRVPSMSALRMAILTAGMAWSTWIVWRLAAAAKPIRRAIAACALTTALALPTAAWYAQFYVW